MYGSPSQAYEAGKRATGSSRQLEAAALTKAARLLDDCRRDWDSPDRDARLKEALENNMRLWTFFQAELSRNDHEMPVALRVDLLRLSSFIDRRSFEILARPEPEKLCALIDIDRQIAAGLSANPGA